MYLAFIAQTLLALFGWGAYLLGAGYNVGLPLCIAAPIALGLIFGYLQRGFWSGREYAGGVTLGTLSNFIFDDSQQWKYSPDTRVYVASASGLASACCLFTARIDEQRVLVVEQGGSDGKVE